MSTAADGTASSAKEGAAASGASDSGLPPRGPARRVVSFERLRRRSSVAKPAPVVQAPLPPRELMSAVEISSPMNVVHHSTACHSAAEGAQQPDAAEEGGARRVKRPSFSIRGRKGAKESGADALAQSLASSHTSNTEVI